MNATLDTIQKLHNEKEAPIAILILNHLKQKKAVTIKTMRSTFVINAMQATHNLNKLEKRGLIKRITSAPPADRRITEVQLTKKGLTLLKKYKL